MLASRSMHAVLLWNARHTLKSSSVGVTLFFNASMMLITLDAGSLSLIAFWSALIRESSSRWSMMTGWRGGLLLIVS